MPPWWNAHTVKRMLTDLISAELSRLRPGIELTKRAGALDQGWASSTPGHAGTNLAESPSRELDLDALDLDSLERLDIATRIAVQFHLYETDQDHALLEHQGLDDWTAIILDSRARWDRLISFQTSGSRAEPKLHAHCIAFLEEEITFFASRLAGHRRVLAAVPSHHIYGFLFAIMLPTRLGLPVVDVRDRLPGAVLARAQTGDLLIAHPAFLDLATRGPVEVPAGVSVVTSTAPCPPEVWQRMSESGVERVMEVYGASETAGIGFRETPRTPFELLPFWSRMPNSAQQIMRMATDGTIIEHGLPDQTQWLDSRRFDLLGRRDGAVQVGGVNVFPERVRRLLCEHPEVADAAVRLAGPVQGGRLKAFVVPAQDCSDRLGLPERLRVWLSGRLSPAEQPRAITIGTQLPQSQLGKLMDWDPGA